jgi:peptide/nickel transport system ATP-binding protein
VIHILTTLVRERGIGLVLITHDMGVVAQACDRVSVLYAGRLAEARPAPALFANPAHPYTRALIDCIPRTGMADGALTGIPGAVPSVAAYPDGCRFHPRCTRALAVCATTAPVLTALPDQGWLGCHNPLGARA